jgi:hypothetical protein
MILASDFPLQRWFLGVKMKKWFWLGILVAMGALGAIAYQTLIAPKAVVVSPMLVNAVASAAGRNPEGCSIWRTAEKKDLLFFQLSSATARMNINGRDITMNFDNESRPKVLKVGDDWVIDYSSDTAKVVLTNTVTALCSANDANCKVAKFSTKMTAKDGERTQSLTGIIDCGS